MAALPPVKLGAIIFVAFAVVAFLRFLFEDRYVTTALIPLQPKRQLYMDFLLVVSAGLIAVIYNTLIINFPLSSGLSLIFGCASFGFFMALDTALARERKIIDDSLRLNHSLPPPKQFFPVTKKFALVAVLASLFVALVFILVIARDIIWLSKIEQSEAALMEATLSVSYEIFFIMAVLLTLTINLILSYSKNLKILFENETNVLEKVSRGDLSSLVPVASNDEFGVIASHTNSMIQGLRHRIELLTDLKVAEEVQRNLLPHTPPQIPGLDLAGVSIYCQETGGDYYDYLNLPEGKLGIVVADAADHGIGAAIHMTTARAFLLYGAKFSTGPAELISNINRYLVKDSAQTGRFVSMFLLEIDMVHHMLRWVRAGHEPAILYDQVSDSFEVLAGEGIVLGVEQDYRFQDFSRNQWTPGSVIVIGTDGIHETQATDGQIFGRERIQHIIRRYHKRSAEEIQQAIIENLDSFRGDAPQEDDVTLVVIKLL